jgi:hypothetical protein
MSYHRFFKTSGRMTQSLLLTLRISSPSLRVLLR